MLGMNEKSAEQLFTQENTSNDRDEGASSEKH